MTIMPQCAFCRHFRGHNGAKSVCEAFSDGIPTVILDNEYDHRQPYPGDNNIRFEQSEESIQLYGVIDLFATEEQQIERVA